MAEVEVRRAAGRAAGEAGLDRRDVLVGPVKARVRRDEDVLLDWPGRRRALVPAAAVEDARLAEVDRAIRGDVAVEGEDVARAVDDLRLGERATGIVRLGDPGIAAGRPVERDVDVVAVVAHG